MAERTAIFNLKVEDGNSAKKVAQNEKNLNKFRKSAEEAGKGTQDFSKRLQSVNKVVDANAFSFREANKLIQDYQTIAIQAGKDSPVGQEAIRKAAQLTDEMGKLRTATNNLSKDGKNLQGAMQLSQGVLGGYQAFAGVTAMLGVENETLMQTMVHLQSVQQVSMGIESARKTLEEGQAARLLLINVRTKALSIGTTVYAGAQNLLNLAIGKGSIAMKVFRTALISTGVGALVVGVGMLIAHFDKVIAVVKQSINWFNELGDGFKTVISIIFPFIGLIRLIGAGLEALGIIENDQDREREKQHQAQTARYKKDRDEIDKKLSKMRDEHKEFEENGNFEIRMMKAQGASKEEIIKAEQNLRKEIIKNNKARIEEIRLQQLLDVAERDRLHAAGEIEAGNKIDDKIKKSNKLFHALVAANKNLNQEIKVEDAKFKTDQESAEEKHQENLSKTRRDAREKDKEDAEKLEQEKEDRLAEIRRTAEDFMIQSIEDEGLRKTTALRTQHKREQDELKKKFGEDTELIKELEAHQADEVRALQKDLNIKKSEEEAKEAEKEREQNLLKLENDLMQLEIDGEETLNKELEIARARRDALLEEEKLTAEEINKINLEFAAKEVEIDKKKEDKKVEIFKEAEEAKSRIRDKSFQLALQLTELFTGESIASQKKAFQVTKAVNLAQATTNTSLAVTAALTGGGNPLKLATGAQFIEAGLAAGAGAVQIANIAKTKFNPSGGGGSVPAPSASLAPSAGGSGGSSGGEGSVNTRQDAEGRSTDSKVFVSETDISRTQDRVNQINVRSSF